MGTFHVIDNTDSIDNTTGLTLDVGDGVLVQSNGSVINTATQGIYLDAYDTGGTIIVNGTVYGAEQGIYSLGQNAQITINGQVYGGLSAQGQGDDVYVSATGLVSGDSDISSQYGTWVNDGTVIIDNQFQIDNGASFINNGLFSGRGFGFFFDGDGTVSVTNSGTIQGDFGTYFNTTSAASVEITNSGTWTDGNIDLTPGVDSVVNTGTITGSVNLGDGNDTLDSSHGVIDGTISGAGGNDVITGGSEDDTISGGTGADVLNGGGGDNTLDYSGSLLSVTVDLTNDIAKHGDAAGDRIQNFENVTGTLKGDTLTGDANANTLDGVLGNDVINGMDGNDTIMMLANGKTQLNGGNGNDLFLLTSADPVDYGPAFSSSTHIDGGAGFDTIQLNGATNVAFGATTVVNVERIQMEDGFNYTLATNDATVASGQTLQLDATALTGGNKLNFNGSAETNGNFTIDGGDGADTIVGGAGNDTIAGDGNADTLTGGGGHDTFLYNDISDSSSTHYDTITDFNASTDTFSLYLSVAHVDTAVTSGSLSSGSFNNDVKNALNGHLLAGDAILFSATAGNLSGHTFLIVDGNGQAGYQSATDLVVDVTGMTGTLTTADFV